MQLSTLHQTPQIHGYRALANDDLLKDILTHGIRSHNGDSYWSYEPIFYYSFYTKGNARTPNYDPNLYANLIVGLFNQNDPSLSGFGDGSILYSYLTNNRDSQKNIADAQHLLNKLPPQLQQQFEKLRTSILNDPTYKEDWNFAGCLDHKWVEPTKTILRTARQHLKFNEVHDTVEFNYDKNLTTTGNSRIAGIYEYKLLNAQRGNQKGVYGLPVDQNGNKLTIPNRPNPKIMAIHTYYHAPDSPINPKQYQQY